MSRKLEWSYLEERNAGNSSPKPMIATSKYEPAPVGFGADYELVYLQPPIPRNTSDETLAEIGLVPEAFRDWLSHWGSLSEDDWDCVLQAYFDYRCRKAFNEITGSDARKDMEALGLTSEAAAELGKLSPEDYGTTMPYDVAASFVGGSLLCKLCSEDMRRRKAGVVANR